MFIHFSLNTFSGRNIRSKMSSFVDPKLLVLGPLTKVIFQNAQQPLFIREGKLTGILAETTIKNRISMISSLGV